MIKDFDGKEIYTRLGGGDKKEKFESTWGIHTPYSFSAFFLANKEKWGNERKMYSDATYSNALYTLQYYYSGGLGYEIKNFKVIRDGKEIKFKKELSIPYIRTGYGLPDSYYRWIFSRPL